MEDINEAIGSILGDPQKMEQLRAVAQSFGLGPPEEPAAEAVPASRPQAAPAQQGSSGGIDPVALASIMQNFQKLQKTFGQTGAAQPALPENSQQNVNTLARVAQIMEAMTQDDENTELLRALKPHFSEARASKVDDAIRVMQLLRAWPALRDSGLLGSLGDILGGGRR